MLWQERKKKHWVISTPNRNYIIMHYNLSSTGSNSTYHDQTNNSNTDLSYPSNRGLNHNSLAGNSTQYGDSQTGINTNETTGMWKQTQLYQSYPSLSCVSTYPKQQLYYAPQTYAYRPITQMQWFNRVPTNYQYYYALTYPKSQNNNLWPASGVPQTYSAPTTPTASIQQPYVSPTYTYPVYTYNANMYNALAGRSSLTTTKKAKKKRKRKNRKKGKENKEPKPENQNPSIETDDSIRPLVTMANSPSTDDETLDPESSMSETRSTDEETDLISQEGQAAEGNLFLLDEGLQEEKESLLKSSIERMLDKQEQELKDLFDEFQLQDDELQFPEFDENDGSVNKNDGGINIDHMDIIDLDPSEFPSKDNISLIDFNSENHLETMSQLQIHLNPGFFNEKDFSDAASDCGSEDIDFVIQRHTPVELNYKISPSESLAAEIELAMEKAKRRQGVVFDDDYACVPLNEEEKLCKSLENFMHDDGKIKGGTRIMLALSKKGNSISYRELQAKEDRLIEQIENEMDMKQSDSGVQSEESGDENDDMKMSKSIKIKPMTEEEEDEIWNIEKCNLRLESKRRTEKSPLIKHLDDPVMPGCGLCCVIM